MAKKETKKKGAKKGNEKKQTKKPAAKKSKAKSVSAVEISPGIYMDINRYEKLKQVKKKEGCNQG